MILLIIITLGLVLLFFYLIKQSKMPSGLIGVLMMKIWNRAYLPMVKWTVTDVAREKACANILDIGVGNGKSTQCLMDVFPNSNIYGIDISEKAISEARKKQSKIDYQVKDVRKTEFTDDYFDIIFAFQTHFHWANLDECFYELNRILTNNGSIFISCEISKINYYLPKLSDNDHLSAYLNKLGLKLLASRKTSNWIEYEIKKIAE